MDNNRADELLNKYIEGKCTPEEVALVESWFLEETKDLADQLPAPDDAVVKEKIWNTIQDKNKMPKKTVRLFPRIAAAAAILLLSGTLAILLNRQDSDALHLQNLMVQNDIPAGKNSATLTLANGRKIRLSDAVKGELAREAGVRITKTKDGQVVYEISAAAKAGANAAQLAYNTIATANGEQYQVILPDGSSVWLNAASSIKFPASFAGTNGRKVELTGEAYFQIAKVFRAKRNEQGAKTTERVPFIVATKKQQVEVLGTHFNINSYDDEPATKTTLLEGRVQVSKNPALRPDNGESITLKPGQQSILQDKTLRVTQADTELAVAWKNNKFMFEKDNIQDIMRMVKRWYNVDVVYDGEITDDKFGGSVSRFDNVSKVLRILELTGNVHFKIEGRRITVTQ